MHMKRFLRFLFVIVALFASAPAWAVLDESSGTNAVNSLSGNVQYAGNTMLPITIAVILICGAIGVYYRLARKAKIGT